MDPKRYLTYGLAAMPKRELEEKLTKGKAKRPKSRKAGETGLHGQQTFFLTGIAYRLFHDVSFSMERLTSFRTGENRCGIFGWGQDLNPHFPGNSRTCCIDTIPTKKIDGSDG